MRILFVLDKLPFPPRDGTTIPTYNWISRLALNHQVYLLYFQDERKFKKQKNLMKNMPLFKKVFFLERYRLSALQRIKAELFLEKPYFLGWIINEQKLATLLDSENFDVVWGSPISVTEVIESIKKYLNDQTVYIIGMSDSNTAVLRSLGKRSFSKGLDFRSRLIYITSLLRSWFVERIEGKILKFYDLILLQTNTDKNWIDKISLGKLSRKTMAVSNGVDNKLFTLPIKENGTKILFIGTLNNGYGKSLEWILKYVWPYIRNKRKDSIFNVVGRGASKKLLSLIKDDDKIIYNEFIPNICEVYKSQAIMLSPVFKGYGLINKVIEAMAAGVPIVGSKESFNGIDGFINRKHGIVAKEAGGFVSETIKLLENPIMRRDIALAARSLVENTFSWEERIQIILDQIDIEMGNKNVYIK